MIKKKKISLEFIQQTKQKINTLLSSKIPQSTKKELCNIIEQLNIDLNIKSDYKYLYWEKYGNLDWNADKHIHFENMQIGDKVNIPREYIVGPNNYDIDIISEIEGEYSRRYIE